MAIIKKGKILVKNGEMDKMFNQFFMLVSMEDNGGGHKTNRSSGKGNQKFSSAASRIEEDVRMSERSENSRGRRGFRVLIEEAKNVGNT